MRSIGSLPKAHLHLHTEASATPETIRKLAEKRHENFEEIWKFNNFEDFHTFNVFYDRLVRLITNPEDLALIISEFVKHEAAQNVIYIEPSIAPQFFTDVFKCSLEESYMFFYNAYKKAAIENGIDFGLIVTVIPQNSQETIESVVNLAIDKKKFGAVSFGIAGERDCGEKSLPLARFCEIAHKGGLKIIPHSGEFEGPESIWKVINVLHPDRLAHGIHSSEDPELLSYLSKHNIVCDVAISSNVGIKIYPSLEDHPVKVLVERGVSVTLNADDEFFFKSSINNEYEIARKHLGLSDEQIAGIAKTSVNAATISDEKKDKALSQIDQWLMNP